MQCSVTETSVAANSNRQKTTDILNVSYKRKTIITQYSFRASNRKKDRKNIANFWLN